jgi:hypothetical protein
MRIRDALLVPHCEQPGAWEYPSSPQRPAPERGGSWTCDRRVCVQSAGHARGWKQRRTSDAKWQFRWSGLSAPLASANADAASGTGSTEFLDAAIARMDARERRPKAGGLAPSLCGFHVANPPPSIFGVGL